MPRARYTITADDVMLATFYVHRRLRNYDFRFAKGVLQTNAAAEFREADAIRSKPAKAAAVNAWCENYLGREDWRKLKSAIRKQRSRWKHEHERRTITISTTAHKLLARLAKRDKVTMSEALEHYLPKALKTTRSRATTRGRARPR